MFTLEVEKGLQLALVEPQFAPLYLEIVTREKEYLSKWLAWPQHAENSDFFLSFIKQSLHDYADGKSLVCAMFYDSNLVGNISFNTINQDLKKVEIGYWLSAEYQGRGIVSKSVTKLIEMAFTKLNIQKIEISAAVENQPSRRVCERLGFSLEGVITCSENLNGRVVDHAIYGLSRKAWTNA
ncbi:RimJ/RimL family protein N-acetyltransferase [Vibrio parahaemolyticus]|uniref:GNAT family N-acetyltransferase n=1 Tax=Vibrio parahaemolyticus TaxID=670 RepID=UPI00111D8776|nr:GNAT family protein [Vibrio parahaemolyticus]TOB49044.1 RimJ/RimL family protein N-acetyltransferase [Vibrio parahaemolyticus]